MLSTESITFSYNSENAFNFPDIQAVKGSPMLILGNSGKGKTTLLHILAGLRKPTTGSVWIGETDITRLSTQELDRFRGKHIGIVFQQSHFVSSLTVKQNLLMAQHFAKMPQNSSKIQELMDRLNLTKKLKQYPYRLSQGEQQRVAIARAIINQPQIILADEPTSSLDDSNCGEVTQLLEEQAQIAGATLIIVTHDARLKDIFPNKIELL